MEILLLRLDRIGDFILGIPAYRALREAHPDDRISVVVPAKVAELAEACPYFDEVFLFEAHWLEPGAPLLNRWKSALKLIRFLRSMPLDMVMDFRYQSRLDPLVAGLSGAKMRIGYNQGWVSWFLSKKVSQPPKEFHQVDRNLHLLDAIGIQAKDRHLEIWADERDKKTAENHMPAQELLPGIPTIAIHVGAATPSKKWMEESFSNLIFELHANTQADILVLGGEHDQPSAHEIVDGLKCPCVNLTGKLTLRQMAALIKDCQVFIGCDSGSTHLAAACGVPVVCLFSAANEENIWRPWGPKVKVMTAHPDCSPCRSHECTRTDGYFCMNEIKVDEVVAEVKALLTGQA